MKQILITFIDIYFYIVTCNSVFIASLHHLFEEVSRVMSRIDILYFEIRSATTV